MYNGLSCVFVIYCQLQLSHPCNLPYLPCSLHKIFYSVKISKVGYDQPDVMLEGKGAAGIEGEESVASEISETKTRKPSREKLLTPKMQELKDQEFKATYEKWKSNVRDIRTWLKQACSECDMYDMMDEVERLDSELKKW